MTSESFDETETLCVQLIGPKLLNIWEHFAADNVLSKFWPVVCSISQHNDE